VKLKINNKVLKIFNSYNQIIYSFIERLDQGHLYPLPKELSRQLMR
jgi:hypothetical protein